MCVTESSEIFVNNKKVWLVKIKEDKIKNETTQWSYTFGLYEMP